MNHLKAIQNLCSTVLTVLFLGWFGISAFKLGFYAKQTPVVRSVVGLLLEERKLSESKQDSLVIKTIQNLLLQRYEEKPSRSQD